MNSTMRFPQNITISFWVKGKSTPLVSTTERIQHSTSRSNLLLRWFASEQRSKTVWKLLTLAADGVVWPYIFWKLTQISKFIQFQIQGHKLNTSKRQLKAEDGAKDSKLKLWMPMSLNSMTNTIEFVQSRCSNTWKITRNFFKGYRLFSNQGVSFSFISSLIRTVFTILRTTGPTIGCLGTFSLEEPCLPKTCF